MESLNTENFAIAVPHCLVLFCIATTLLNPVLATKVCEFPAILNFGDSNSDTGGLAASLIAPTPPYGETYFHRPAGRFSDGRLVIDFIGICLIDLLFLVLMFTDLVLLDGPLRSAIQMVTYPFN